MIPLRALLPPPPPPTHAVWMDETPPAEDRGGNSSGHTQKQTRKKALIGAHKGLFTISLSLSLPSYGWILDLSSLLSGVDGTQLRKRLGRKRWDSIGSGEGIHLQHSLAESGEQ